MEKGVPVRFRRWLNRIHRTLGRSSLAFRLALKLRNQCDALIACHLGESVRPQANGEAWLLGLIAPESACFVDVGANVGEWAEMFTRAMPGAGKGLCFEPCPAVRG